MTAGQSTTFIEFDTTNMVITWRTTDTLNAGEFEITIKGTINRVTQVFDTYTFKIIVTNIDTVLSCA